ncbi:histone-lysine N-methyltransferase SETMAR [Plakobranchus ocellatus]|uniref:Histone-lysine N-methyltransferase SETMAR n=1 Tax=Plakobranchus ocellatus TaxID=259542 RepID=A0AAV4ADB0_9GAST|nr:histone-lysine N-methyltransferase SETMAR [Plakobranchus ocellatus]
MSISARESKSPKSCCTGVNKKVMKPLMWGLAGTIVPGTSFLNTSSLEMKLVTPEHSGDKTRLNDMEAPIFSCRSGVVLQHDNATPHTAKRTKEWLERYRWDIIPHPFHSPDLAPPDFHLYGPLKCHLGGKKFEDEDELIGEVRC